MDLASIIGMLGCAAAVVYGIVSGDQGFAALGNFYDFSSILITSWRCSPPSAVQTVRLPRWPPW